VTSTFNFGTNCSAVSAPARFATIAGRREEYDLCKSAGQEKAAAVTKAMI